MIIRVDRPGSREIKRMQEILSTALSLLSSLGILPFISAMLVIALVGGFIAVIFRSK